MRLSARQSSTIRAAVREIFGADATLYLFGSRVDDQRRGGDYDFYLETDLSDADDIVQRKLTLMCRLHASPDFEDEKIDIVVRPQNATLDLPIYRVAKAQGVRL